MRQYRQGDVLIVEVGAVPDGAVEDTTDGDLVLALGEATGHRHRFAAGNRPRMLRDAAGSMRYLTMEQDCDLLHEEHDRVRVGAGVWRVVHPQREYTPAGLRSVAD